MKVVNLRQSGEDWLEWRKQGVTASDAAILLGLSPYKTYWRLWAEKVGYAREVDLSNNPLVRQGIENEDKARVAFELKHGEILLPVCVESSTDPRLRASLDGLASNNVPVELKCPSESTWNDVCSNGTTSKAYLLYYAQVQHQMLVTGADEGWLVFWREGMLREFKILRDDSLIAEIIWKSEELLHAVFNRIEPKKDPERDLYIPKEEDEVEQWIASAEEYRFCEAEIQRLTKQLNDLKSRQAPMLDEMKRLMGEYHFADYAGVMVTRYKVSGKVDYKSLIADKGISEDEVSSYRKPSSERTRVTVTQSVTPRYIVEEEVLAPLKDVPEQAESCYF